HAERAVQIASEVDHPFSAIVADCGLGLLRLDQGDVFLAIEPLERSLTICRDWHIPLMFPWVASTLGIAYARADRAAEALPLIAEAVERAGAMGLLGRQALQVAWLGEAHLAAGHRQDARSLAQRALDLSRRHGERGHEAWALWLLGNVWQDEASADWTADAHLLEGR